MLQTYEQRSKLKLTITVLTILVVVGIVLLADYVKSHKQTATSTAAQSTTTSPSTSTNSSTTPATTSTTSTTSSTSTSGYKDGTYTASSDYYVPHGSENIGVTLTVKDGVITDSSITNSEGDHDSVRYQEDFAAAYKSYVVGQKLSGFKLGIISGASDTTEGFNDAVSQITTKAQAS